MELGQRLKQARLEAGLSQRQLCADTVTRNMLSQIENGAARPSMDTLQILAARLGKTVGYFLGEEDRKQTQDDFLAQLLQRGEQALADGQPETAMVWYRAAELIDPHKAWPQLEKCCLALEDYKGAYEYACRQR